METVYHYIRNLHFRISQESKKTVIFLRVMSDNFEGQKNMDIARCLVTYTPLSPGYIGFGTVRYRVRVAWWCSSHAQNSLLWMLADHM
jgi:hypothetical protein